MDFSIRLKELRDKKGITQTELARDLEIGIATVGMWESSKRRPPAKMLERLSNYFNVSIDYLLGVKQKPSATNGIMVPVLGRVPAGIPLEAIEEIIDWEEITPDMAAMGDIFALTVKGDSMSPMILDGDTILIKKQFTVENGEIAVVYVNGYDATLKKIKYDQRGIYLMPYNSAYEVHFYSNEEIEKMPVAICGKMLELRRKYY